MKLKCLLIGVMVMSMVASQSAQEREWQLLNGEVTTQVDNLPTVSDPNWRVVTAVDLNGDHIIDRLWVNDVTGAVVIWYMRLDPNNIAFFDYAVMTNVPLPVPPVGRRWTATVTTNLSDTVVRIQWHQEAK